MVLIVNRFKCLTYTIVELLVVLREIGDIYIYIALIINAKPPAKSVQTNLLYITIFYIDNCETNKMLVIVV